jgi:hypothetical protein
MVGALGLLVASAHVAAQGADPRMGTWKVNVAKSKFPGEPPKSLVRTFEDLGGGWIYVTTDAVNAKGVAGGNRTVHRCDGRDYPMAAKAQTAYITASCKRTGANTFDLVFKADGKAVGNATDTISTDGRSYTFTQKGTNPQGQPVETVQIFDKQ